MFQRSFRGCRGGFKSFTGVPKFSSMPKSVPSRIPKGLRMSNLRMQNQLKMVMIIAGCRTASMIAGMLNEVELCDEEEEDGRA